MIPISKKEMTARGWDEYDYLFISGDAYVDHPSFGMAVIARVLEDAGYRVCILAEPNSKDKSVFRSFGKPKKGVLITGGNIDSMVANYTVNGKKRHDDAYATGGKGGRRPDRAAIVYSNIIREIYPDITIILGGIEASLRRFVHYDFWDDALRKSILADANADILAYGMGERTILELAEAEDYSQIKGICYLKNSIAEIPAPFVSAPSFDECVKDKKQFARAFKISEREHCHSNGKRVIQQQDERFLVVNPPQAPLSREELDKVFALPYERTYHPSYKDKGGVPALTEVEHSIIHNRGCFGACNFCSLAFHQGKVVTSRSHESVLEEAKKIINSPTFKGYINDVGGPTANFREPACKKQLTHDACKDKRCLAPTPCENLEVSHQDYLSLLRKLRALDGVKKVFIRSGIRFDYLVYDENDAFFEELVKYHISGQLKVAPEHCVDSVLTQMGKPKFEVFERFRDQYNALNRKNNLKQFLVMYLISSHPGTTMEDAEKLADYLKKIGARPEQVQNFYPTPGTLSTAIYYLGFDPLTGKEVHVPKGQEREKQRQLLQYYKMEKSHDKAFSKNHRADPKKQKRGGHRK